MLTTSPIPRQTVGRTFLIAIIALGVTAFIQVAAVCWAIVSHSRSGTQTASASTGAKSTPAPEAGKENFTDPFAQENPSNHAATTNSAQGGTVGVLNLHNPTPIPREALATPMPPTQAHLEELIQQANELSERGDISTALIHLREAQVLAPEDPRVLAGLAMAYEKLGAADKALEAWQHIFGLGKAVGGKYYDMADSRLNPPEATTTTAPDPSKPDTSEFRPNAVLALLDVAKEDSQDMPDKKFTLKVPVRARPGTPIDVNDVEVGVFIYERIEDGTVVLNNADVVSKWVTSPIDWSKNDIQVLQVGYTAASVDPKLKSRESRNYYGYIVRVYYKGSLQDVRAEPITLLKQYPAPATLSNEDDQ